jgi:hypothetical protein
MLKAATLLLCVSCAAGQLASNATEVIKTPNPNWARSPHMAPGSENEKGHVDVGGAPAPVEGQVPASPGVYKKANIHSRMPNVGDQLINTDINDNRTEAEKRPLLPNPAVVLTPEGPSAYNSSGGYEGKGSPINGTYTADYAAQKAPICCRICPESNDCQDKDNCFHTCHRTCGDVCQIHHHYEPAAGCDATTAAPAPAPSIVPTGADALAVHEAEYGQKMNTIKKVLRGVPLPAKVVPMALRP